MIDLGLGRRFNPDERDRNFPLRIAEPVAVEGKKRWWEGGAWLDQGNTGTCVGHGWAHEIEDAPVTHPNDVVDPYAIYDLATVLDPWPDNDHDVNGGTSVRAGAQAAQQLGFIGQYLWAFNIDTVIQAILTMGPVVVGTNWYGGMFEPRWDGDRAIIEISGAVVGGHCYVLNAVNTTSGWFRMKNSWGRGWAKQGHASISIDAMARLLSEEGEACMPTDVQPAA